MTNNDKYQDAILHSLQEEKTPITLFLQNGVRLQGTLINYDDAVLLMEVEGRMQIIFRQALSTIIPHRSVQIEI